MSVMMLWEIKKALIVAFFHFDILTHHLYIRLVTKLFMVVSDRREIEREMVKK